ncbi:MAG: HSP20 family small heat-shock protein [Microscillaceae bacterium]|jgi:HSP20 family protein|nr:HSP20 family small heat-shock protein [Microscillaceae bacterium]
MSLLYHNNDSYRRFNSKWRHFIDGTHFLGQTPFAKNMIQNEEKTPAMNVKENEKSFDLQIALPGFQRDEVSIHLENGFLKVIAIQNEQIENKDNKWVIQEFDRNSLTRIFRLHEDVDEENISAKLVDGILHVQLPFKASSPEQPKREIQVN